MHTYQIILIPTLISTLNVPICKFKYQNMIIMQINSICMINCADYHLPDHNANIIQPAVKVILMHNTVVYMYLHSYKINILILY